MNTLDALNMMLTDILGHQFLAESVARGPLHNMPLAFFVTGLRGMGFAACEPPSRTTTRSAPSWSPSSEPLPSPRPIDSIRRFPSRRE